MKEIKLTIDGKEVQLTDEQLKLLGFEVRKNPFERVAKSEMYCYIDSFNEVHCIADEADNSDEMSFECSNYFNDETFAKQIALHHLLYRKLLKFAYDNKCEDNQIWGCNGIEHWHIGYDFGECAVYADWASTFKYNDVYFSTKEGAERAIKEVVEPFMKEHPEFVW